MLLEFALLGRGGQGLYTTLELLSHALSLEGYMVHAMPFFGAERRGAPIAAYLRVSDRKILRHDFVSEADGILLGDASEEVTSAFRGISTKPAGKVIVNSSRAGRLPAPWSTASETFELRADDLAVSEGLVISGWPVIGPALAGAFSRVFGMPSLESLKAAASKVFDNANLLKKSIALLVRGYNEVRRAESVFKDH